MNGPNYVALSAKIPPRKRTRQGYVRQIPVVGKSIEPVNTALRRQTQKLVNVVSGEEGGTADDETTDGDGVYPRYGSLTDSASPPGWTVSHHLPNATYPVGVYWPLQPGGADEPGAMMPAWQFAIGRMAASRVCTLAHFQESGSRLDETTPRALWSKPKAQTPVNSDVSGRIDRAAFFAS